MIETLHIENVGIIDNMTINLKPGLNILTGETGAGKTLIIDSLSLICGNRFSKEIIKTGKDYCYVEIMLKNENDFTDNIIISREINSAGKNKCKINGRMVTVNELKLYMSNVINIHGQNDNQNLFNISNHIGYLDAYSKDSLKKLKSEYEILYKKYMELNSELLKNYGDPKEIKRKFDLLDYEIKEINDAKLEIGEEEILESESKIMRNSEKIYEVLDYSESRINNVILTEFDKTLKEFSKIKEFDTSYLNINERIESVYYDLEDIINDIYVHKDNICFDKQKNMQIIERLDTIYNLKRKYGNDISEILKYKEKIEKEKQNIENMEDHLNNVSIQIQSIKEKMLELSKKMDIIRRKSAIELESNINSELEQLEMKNSKVKVNITFNQEDTFNKNGLNKVVFKISTNIGEEYKDLNKIASGGEISRIMLAIKRVLMQVDKVETLIFDEVDSGISGKAGKAVGFKLKSISNVHQVICVTHLAVVAAYADTNYYISKSIQNNSTFSNIKMLNENETLEEIARISNGNLTDAAIVNAKELKKQACFV